MTAPSYSQQRCTSKPVGRGKMRSGWVREKGVKERLGVNELLMRLIRNAWRGMKRAVNRRDDWR